MSWKKISTNVKSLLPGHFYKYNSAWHVLVIEITEKSPYTRIRGNWVNQLNDNNTLINHIVSVSSTDIYDEVFP